MHDLLDFLDRLEQAEIYYRLNKIREGVLVEIAVPGERWEVEFLRDGEIQVERFISEGEIKGKDRLEQLFSQFGG